MKNVVRTPLSVRMGKRMVCTLFLHARVSDDGLTG